MLSKSNYFNLQLKGSRSYKVNTLLGQSHSTSRETTKVTGWSPAIHTDGITQYLFDTIAKAIAT